MATVLALEKTPKKKNAHLDMTPLLAWKQKEARQNCLTPSMYSPFGLSNQNHSLTARPNC
jgi:hypothetical protein